MFDKKNKRLIKLINACIFVAAIYSWLQVSYKDSFIGFFAESVVIPIMILLLGLMINDWNQNNNTVQMIEEISKLKELGIINEKEYQYRKNLIIDIENRKIEKNHKDDPELQSKEYKQKY